MSEKFHVDLKVSLFVHASDLSEAKGLAQQWLQQAVQGVAAESPVSHPIVSSPSGIIEEKVTSSRSFAEWEREGARASRWSGGEERLALLGRVNEARTTEDYLAVEPAVSKWLSQHEEHYNTALSRLNRLLGTLKEAIRWTNEHPNGPAIWNVGMLLVQIKASVQEELSETKAARQNVL